MQGIIAGINNTFNLYFWLLILRVLLTWIPNIDWYKQPFKALREVCDIYLDLFRKIVPPIGGLDVSPVIALIVLQVIQYVLIFVLAKFVI